jgi:hypothetical protein
MADRDKGRTLWREEVIQEANRGQSDLDRSEFVPDAEGRRHVEDRLHQARDAAEAHERRWKRVRSWWSGVDIEAAWRAIHAAKQELIDGMGDPDLRAQYPLLRSKVKQYLEPNDPERVEYEKWLERGEEQESLDQFDRAKLRTVRTAVDATSDAQYAKIHRFRTTLYIGFVAVIVLDIVLGLERSTDPWLPICPVGVRNCDHALDLRIRSGRRRRPLPLRMPGKRVVAIRFGCLGDGTALTLCGAVPKDLSPADSDLITRVCDRRQVPPLRPSRKAIRTDLTGAQFGRSRRSQG